MLMDDVRAEQLLGAIEPAILDSLTSEQREGIRAAARRDGWERHPVNIRLSLPLPLGRCYVTLVAGRDRRSQARRDKDRRRHPLDTAGNLLFAAGATVVFGTLSIALLSLNG